MTSTLAHAGAVLVSSITSVFCLLALVVSLGLLFVITVPASLGAWALARGARSSSSAAVRGLAVVGQTLAGLACTLSCLVVGTWAIVLLA